MSGKEKMIKVFNILREIVMILVMQFRFFYWKLFFKKIGKPVRFYGNIKVLRPYNIIIGNNCALNDDVLLNARSEIIIGDNVVISSGVSIITAGLKYDTKREHFEKEIIIEDNVWIGSGVLILPGVTVGKNSVIGFTHNRIRFV